MSLLNDDIRQQVRDEFDNLSQPVKLVMFTQEMECQYCSETRELVEEVAAAVRQDQRRGLRLRGGQGDRRAV